MPRPAVRRHYMTSTSSDEVGEAVYAYIGQLDMDFCARMRDWMNERRATECLLSIYGVRGVSVARRRYNEWLVTGNERVLFAETVSEIQPTA